MIFRVKIQYLPHMPFRSWLFGENVFEGKQNRNKILNAQVTWRGDWLVTERQGIRSFTKFNFDLISRKWSIIKSTVRSYDDAVIFISTLYYPFLYYFVEEWGLLRSFSAYDDKWSSPPTPLSRMAQQTTRTTWSITRRTISSLETIFSPSRWWFTSR